MYKHLTRIASDMGYSIPKSITIIGELLSHVEKDCGDLMVDDNMYPDVTKVKKSVKEFAEINEFPQYRG
jgi:hypothetical protein